MLISRPRSASDAVMEGLCRIRSPYLFLAFSSCWIRSVIR